MSQSRAAYRVDYEAELARAVVFVGLPAPVRQYLFHPVRKWRFDLAFPDYMLAVEVDGGTFTNGRHTRGAGYAEDCIKYAEAVTLGWRVLRFTTGQVQDGTALRYIETALKQRG